MDWFKRCDTDVESLVHSALQFGLAAGEQVAHGFNPGAGFCLQPRDFRHYLCGQFPIASTHSPDCMQQEGTDCHQSEKAKEERPGQRWVNLKHRGMLRDSSARNKMRTRVAPHLCFARPEREMALH
jgi:hypothetical protein